VAAALMCCWIGVVGGLGPSENCIKLSSGLLCWWLGELGWSGV
jgi:hypothetical protein